ncbi:MAG: hypothetical protein ACPGPC_07065 [Alphaproteobacteria bacterium]
MVSNDDGIEIAAINALSVQITRKESSNIDVVNSIYDGIVSGIFDLNQMSLNAFLRNRKDYRNKIFYADDDKRNGMGETLEELLPVFIRAYRDLLWTLGLMVANKVPSDSWGVVSQFISVYRRVLKEAGVIKSI